VLAAEPLLLKLHRQRGDGTLEAAQVCAPLPADLMQTLNLQGASHLEPALSYDLLDRLSCHIVIHPAR
jgi:hypothetical protein